MNENDFFKTDDPREQIIDDQIIPTTWWSRGYEYPWALRYAKAGDRVADMGCGYTHRPLKNWLAERCGHAYWVDGRMAMLELACPYTNVTRLVAQMDDTKLPDDALDALFCISVLEETNTWRGILGEFARVLRPGGLAVLTFDVPYDITKPLGQYTGLYPLEVLDEAALRGLHMRREAHLSFHPDKTVNHEEYNLCTYHCVLQNA